MILKCIISDGFQFFIQCQIFHLVIGKSTAADFGDVLRQCHALQFLSPECIFRNGCQPHREGYFFQCRLILVGRLKRTLSNCFYRLRNLQLHFFAVSERVVSDGFQLIRKFDFRQSGYALCRCIKGVIPNALQCSRQNHLLRNVSLSAFCVSESSDTFRTVCDSGYRRTINPTWNNQFGTVLQLRLTLFGETGDDVSDYIIIRKMSGAPRCLCCRNPTDNQLLHIGFSVGNIFQTIRYASGCSCIYVYHAAGLFFRCSRFYLFLAGISDKRISLHGSGGLRDFYRLNFVSGKAARFHYRRIITGILEAYFPNLVGFKRTFTDSL